MKYTGYRIEIKKQKNRNDPDMAAAKVAGSISFPLKRETEYVIITEIIPLAMHRSIVKRYLPITTSVFPSGKIPYNLLSLFFSYIEKYIPEKGAVIIITTAIVMTCVLAITPMKEPIK
ncbi:MAG: hypothetical protein Q8920_13570 [Bacillota bacterium]|nr:hypothetical protein [Bacillota bacterium]